EVARLVRQLDAGAGADRSVGLRPIDRHLEPIVDEAQRRRGVADRLGRREGGARREDGGEQSGTDGARATHGRPPVRNEKTHGSRRSGVRGRRARGTLRAQQTPDAIATPPRGSTSNGRGSGRELGAVLAGAGGLEPPDGGSKGRCLTSLATPQRVRFYSPLGG